MCVQACEGERAAASRTFVGPRHDVFVQTRAAPSILFARPYQWCNASHSFDELNSIEPTIVDLPRSHTSSNWVLREIDMIAIPMTKAVSPSTSTILCLLSADSDCACNEQTNITDNTKASDIMAWTGLPKSFGERSHSLRFLESRPVIVFLLAKAAEVESAV